MKIRSLAMASLFALSVLPASAQFATSVVDYNPGTGFAAGFTNPAAALGAPSSSASVTPFAPPFSKSQIVSIGTNGWLTLEFNPPIINDPSNPFGLDFLVFGNSFFGITNGNFSGGGITSGAIGGNNTGSTMVEVSADGVNWYTLNPALAPTFDGLFPTDGRGNPRLPVNPALTTNDFGGLGLSGIRALYNGSAGGTGFDVSWAQDTNGYAVDLPIVRYVRLDVLSNKSEVDAVSAVQGSGNVFADDFYSDPLQNGWQVFGNTNLFYWNPTNEDVEVTWNSTNVNSYFYHPLGTVLTRDDAFSVSFDIQLSDAVAFNYGQELAVGLFNLADATNSSFSRGGGTANNIFEMDYFPDTGFGDSIDATLIDTNTGFTYFYFAYDNLPLNPGVTYQIKLMHAAGTTNLTGEVLTNGVVYTSLPLTYPGPITDFRLDTLSISSYQDDGFGDSVLAHGTVKNFLVSLPSSPVQNFAGQLQGGQWQGQFLSRSNWVYTLERSADLQSWSAVQSGIPGTGTNARATDPEPPADKSFYRILAQRP
jgi:hypothetical protein